MCRSSHTHSPLSCASSYSLVLIVTTVCVDTVKVNASLPESMTRCFAVTAQMRDAKTIQLHLLDFFECTECIIYGTTYFDVLYFVWQCADVIMGLCLEPQFHGSSHQSCFTAAVTSRVLRQESWIHTPPLTHASPSANTPPSTHTPTAPPSSL